MRILHLCSSGIISSFLFFVVSFLGFGKKSNPSLKFASIEDFEKDKKKFFFKSLIEFASETSDLGLLCAGSFFIMIQSFYSLHVYSHFLFLPNSDEWVVCF